MLCSHFELANMDDSCGLAYETQFIFESKFKIEETPSHLGTSMTSEDDNES